MSRPAVLGNLRAFVMQQVNLGLVGGGTVGGGVFQALQRHAALMASRLGVKLHVARVAVRDFQKARNVALPADLLTSDWRAVVHDPQLHVIVELMGGTSTAKDVVLSALRLGKPVVTANKALLSAHGEELFTTAQLSGRVSADSRHTATNGRLRPGFSFRSGGPLDRPLG